MCAEPRPAFLFSGLLLLLLTGPRPGGAPDDSVMYFDSKEYKDIGPFGQVRGRLAHSRSTLLQCFGSFLRSLPP
jgi:hypothetical protein